MPDSGSGGNCGGGGAGGWAEDVGPPTSGAPYWPPLWPPGRPSGIWFRSWIVEVGRCVGTLLILGKSPPDPVSVLTCVPPFGALVTTSGTSLPEEQPASDSPAMRAAAQIPRR